jgi:hypothetical protein
MFKGEMMKIDFDVLLPRTMDGRSPDVSFILKYAKEKQAEGNLSDVEILQQCLVHLADESNHLETAKIRSLNKQVSEGIVGLCQMDRSSNLRAIAEHATEALAEVHDKRCKENGDDAGGHSAKARDAAKLRLAVMYEGWNAYGEIFMPEFLAKHGWKVEGKKDGTSQEKGVSPMEVKETVKEK